MRSARTWAPRPAARPGVRLGAGAAKPCDVGLTAMPDRRDHRPTGLELAALASALGAAAGLVLAHGWTEQLSYWTSVIGELVARGLRLVAYDLRGHGRSGLAAGGVARLTVPTLVVTGDCDKLTPPSHSHRIAETLPDLARLIELPDTGHMSPLERPAELSAALGTPVDGLAPIPGVPVA